MHTASYLLIFMERARIDFLGLDMYSIICYVLSRPKTSIHSELSALYAIALPSVRLSVTWVDQSKMADGRIMKFLPYGSPMALFAR